MFQLAKPRQCSICVSGCGYGDRPWGSHWTQTILKTFLYSLWLSSRSPSRVVGRGIDIDISSAHGAERVTASSGRHTRGAGRAGGGEYGGVPYISTKLSVVLGYPRPSLHSSHSPRPLTAHSPQPSSLHRGYPNLLSIVHFRPTVSRVGDEVHRSAPSLL